MTLRVALMGAPDFALPAFAEVAARHTVVAAYTQPPRPAGRGQQARPVAVHAWAESQGIPVHTPPSLKDPDVQAAFRAHRADVAVVAAYGLLLPKPVLDAPRLGCVNVHASLLPRWRGAAPINRAIMAGDSETGVTIMHMEEGLDTGPMLASAVVPIGPKTTAGALHDRLADVGAHLLPGVLEALEAGMVAHTPQPQEGITYAAKISKAEAALDWTRDAVALACHVRGLSPFPGAHTMLPDGGRLKVLMAHPEPHQHGATPGTLLDPQGLVACGTDALRLVTVQKAGKAPMALEAFLRGNGLPPGTMLG